MSMVTIASRGVRMLGVEEEAMLFHRHREGHERATRRLIEAHWPLINKIAGRYSRFGPRHGDAVQEGVAGFIEGLRRFDPERGFRISTFCRWWIRASVADWQRADQAQVRSGTTATQKRLLASLGDARARLGIYDEGVPARADLDRLAAHLAATPEEVADMCVRMSPGAEVGLDVRIRGADGDGAALIEMIADDAADPEGVDEDIDDRRRSAALRAALAGLDARKRAIIERRYLADVAETLEDLSATYGVTRERIRQLEVQAIEELGLAIPAKLSRMAGQDRRDARR